MLVAQSAVVRTVPDLRDRELLRRLRNGGEIIEVLVMISACPDLDLPCSVLGTGLDDIDGIILDDLLGLDGLHTFGAECVGLSDLL